MTDRGARPGGSLVPEQISGIAPGYPRVWVEVPRSDGPPGAWCYTDRTTYAPGEVVSVKLSSTIPSLEVRLYRDGSERTLVQSARVEDVPFQAVPERGYELGFGWADTFQLALPTDAEPGGYLLELIGDRGVLGHGFFVVAPQRPRRGSIALILSTATWTAYNDVGGASHYYGIHPGTTRGRSPILSLDRPWARGQVHLPDHAPRMIDNERSRRPLGPRYKSIEWAYLHNNTKYYAAAGWATYERHFARWCEANGYLVDIYTQSDLEDRADLLESYACVAFVGHDEYWSRRMRQRVDDYVEGGGRVARFAGNFMWQIRLDTETSTQTSYKYDARAHDPVVGTPDEPLMTGAWDDPLTRYPGAKTFGVTALRGMYAAFGAAAQRAVRGFTVFRDDHWLFEGTGLGYGDVFGDDAAVFGYEVDGLEYTFDEGLPVPTGVDGAPEGLKILAMNWATSRETALPEHQQDLMIGDGDAVYTADILDQGATPENVTRRSRTTGMIVHFQRGEGEVLTIGSTEWVNGLREQEHYVERCTRNILDRFLRSR